MVVVTGGSFTSSALMVIVPLLVQMGVGFLSFAGKAGTIDIAATIGSSYAYVGFTGSTWYYNATQDIQTWVFSN